MLEFNFTPFPTLETERTLLRQLSLDDAPEYLTIRSDPRVMQHLARPVSKSEKDAARVIQAALAMLPHEGISWGIEHREYKRLIGTIGYYRSKPQNYRSEIGYELHPDFWGKGLMSEAMRAVLSFGFTEMGLNSIEADVDPANGNSIALLERNGFVREALFRENCFFEGAFLDSAVYSLLKSNFAMANFEA